MGVYAPLPPYCSSALQVPCMKSPSKCPPMLHQQIVCPIGAPPSKAAAWSSDHNVHQLQVPGSNPKFSRDLYQQKSLLDLIWLRP